MIRVLSALEPRSLIEGHGTVDFAGLRREIGIEC
jgi:hypothetical protein